MSTWKRECATARCKRNTRGPGQRLCNACYMRNRRLATGQTTTTLGKGNMQALAWAAPTPDQLDARLAERGYYQPEDTLTGLELLARLWGRTA